MKRFWQVVDDKVSSGENTETNVYMYIYRDGYLFVQAYNEYHLFQQLHDKNKLKMGGDGDLFQNIVEFFEDYETEDIVKIVDYMLLNCGHWSRCSFKKIDFMTDYHDF